MTIDDHKWLTISEAAQELRVSVPTIRRWIRAGRLAASRIGDRSVRIQRRELALVARPTKRDQEKRSDADASDDEFGQYIQMGDPSIRTKTLIRRLRKSREAILAAHGGVPLSDSAPLIRQAREERNQRL